MVMSLITNGMVKVHTDGTMEKCTKVSGLTIYHTAAESEDMQMVTSLLVNLSMAKNMVMGLSLGKWEMCTSDSMLTVTDMVKAK